VANTIAFEAPIKGRLQVPAAEASGVLVEFAANRSPIDPAPVDNKLN
jgi:hypothetical protein